MTINWEEIKWIFKPDGAYRDIYVENVSIQEWKILVDYLNNNHIIKFGPTGKNKIINKIEKKYVCELLIDEAKELECRTASILIEKIIINTHFFYDKEIEFDIDPIEINSANAFKNIINFMNDISKILGRKVILTGEFPLVEVDFKNEILKALTEKEAEKLWK
ncbi:hypothetical protein ACFPVY_03060 [Flavobacterium qiangtangense]|uniref:Uncharacterized protein n=1 Tax=Flavobacterium qiangtangense TaxID=1442595 RepID=A0ABW1PJY5_9FLAO